MKGLSGPPSLEVARERVEHVPRGTGDHDAVTAFQGRDLGVPCPPRRLDVSPDVRDQGPHRFRRRFAEPGTRGSGGTLRFFHTIGLLLLALAETGVFGPPDEGGCGWHVLPRGRHLRDFLRLVLGGWPQDAGQDPHDPAHEQDEREQRQDHFLSHQETSGSMDERGRGHGLARQQGKERQAPVPCLLAVIDFEAVAESRQASSHARTDGVDGHVQSDGDCARRQRVQVPKHERGPVVLGQTLDRADEPSLDLEAVDDVLLGRDPLGACDVSLAAPVYASLAEQVPGLMSRDARKPRSQGAAPTRPIPQRGEPRLLDDVVDEIVAMQRCSGHSTHERSVLQEVFGVERRTGGHGSTTGW